MRLQLRRRTQALKTLNFAFDFPLSESPPELGLTANDRRLKREIFVDRRQHEANDGIARLRPQPVALDDHEARDVVIFDAAPFYDPPQKGARDFAGVTHGLPPPASTGVTRPS
jgi:hypothetical protein